MALPSLFGDLTLPVIAAPMFLASGPDLVVEACRCGVVGAFPALNRLTSDGFGEWLDIVQSRLEGLSVPFAVNLVIRKNNRRLEDDLVRVVEAKVPLVVTSLGASREIVEAIQSYGGLVFHDVVQRRHAEKAADAGVDGIIAVCAGAGGHGGAMSPFALLPEIREIFSGTIVLGGAINTGAQIAAARLMGADLVYMGTRFLATAESEVQEAYKQMIVASKAADIVYTPNISGVPANFLRASIEAKGLDPNTLPPYSELSENPETHAWSSLWSAGQGAGGIDDVPSVAELCMRLRREYRAAIQSASSDPFARLAEAA